MNRQDGLIEQITANDCLRLQEHEHLYNKWLDLTKTSPKSTVFLLGRLAETHNDWANWHLVNGEYDKARRAMSKQSRRSFPQKTSRQTHTGNACSRHRPEGIPKTRRRTKKRRVIA